MTQLAVSELMKLTPEKMVEVARSTLQRVETPALDVYKATDLTPAWQQAFVTGRAKDPAYTRMVRLIDWLVANHKEIFFDECSAQQ